MQSLSEQLASASDVQFRTLLDKLPAAAYTCDRTGLITYFNQFAVDLWGRAPKLNDPADRFCGSFKLYTIERDPIPHNRCWMALALETGNPYNGYELLIERPTGECVMALAYANPIPASSNPEFAAVNVLVDVTDQKRAAETQSRLAAIVDSSDDAIVGKTLDGIVTSWNTSAENLFGYTASEAIGQSIRRIIPSDRQDEEQMILDRIRSGDRIEHYETVRISKSGRLVDVSVSVSPVRDASGRIIGASKIARDVSMRRQTEQALRESERRFAALAELVPQLVWTARADGRIDFFNLQWYAFTGYSPEQSAGHGWIDVLHPDDRHRAINCWAQAIDSGEPVECEYRLRAADGHYEWFLARGVALRDDAGRVERWFGTCTGIDRIKKLEAALKDADRRKNEFLGMLAHELRNPLAVISSASQTLERVGGRDKQAAKLATMILRQTRNLARMVDDLLDVSRITRGTIRLTKEVVDLGTIIGRAIETARTSIDDRGHELVIRLTAQPLQLEADPTRLEQIIVNLLNNAAKYTNPGGTIELSASRQGDMLELRVRDNGIGIPQHMLGQIFELFTQVDSTSRGAQSGLGIGLSLVHTLVQLHNGTIFAHSGGAGMGSEFTVQLPALSGVRDEQQPAANCRGALIRANRANRVVVVDDNPQAAQSLSVLLRIHGYDVRMVTNAAAALEAARAEAPDVMLIDIGMPGMNGYELARRLRADATCARVRLIALTGYGSEVDRCRAFEAGFTNHLVKPLTVDAFEQLIEDNSPTAQSAKFEKLESAQHGTVRVAPHSSAIA